ncbi:hypothetical protein R1T16_09990 [Flavobacterium sp. DG1-102-2]|uniref:hypothetical protein n=1 Tax=Flavobacterium sp. DG1-102-2 TaxID=3081663 RepID=UPI002948DD31|nr:hypothetical protein [Flavobacterium sp. DG1-102-2]MDV6168756.1 hypothetical protein [Flavobacterium sp. DG1-102-2]
MDKKHPELEQIVNFLTSINIEVVEAVIPETTFLPGLHLGPNTIFIDFSKLKYPGDLLHEAGHIAVTTPTQRELIGTENMPEDWPTQGDEIAAILWSYAALNHLNLPTEFVFHENGYKGSSEWFIENFTNGRYMGLPLLQWFGMAHSNDDVSNYNKPAFPAMQNWLRPE